MQEGKTIGQLMEEMRQKAGAQNYRKRPIRGCIEISGCCM